MTHQEAGTNLSVVYAGENIQQIDD
jgi:hypothetical protein